MTQQFTPIISLNNMYVNSMHITYVDDTKFTVSHGQCRDSNNVLDILIPSIITVDCSVNGINGLDVGSFSANLWYYILAIADSSGFKEPGYLVSLSRTSPTLPAGYDSQRYLGQVLTDSSAHIWPFVQTGDSNYREYFFTPINVLDDGEALDFAPVDLSSAIPPLDNIKVYLQVILNPSMPGDISTLRTPGTQITFYFDSTDTTVFQSLPIYVLSKLVDEAPTIEYQVSTGASLIIYAQSYHNFI